MVTWFLNSAPVRWAATIFVLLAGFSAALWRAYVRGELEAERRQREANLQSEVETHEKITRAVGDAGRIDRDDRAEWLREYARRNRQK